MELRQAHKRRPMAPAVTPAYPPPERRCPRARRQASGRPLTFWTTHPALPSSRGACRGLRAPPGGAVQGQEARPLPAAGPERPSIHRVSARAVSADGIYLSILQHTGGSWNHPHVGRTALGTRPAGHRQRRPHPLPLGVNGGAHHPSNTGHEDSCPSSPRPRPAAWFRVPRRLPRLSVPGWAGSYQALPTSKGSAC